MEHAVRARRTDAGAVPRALTDLTKHVDSGILYSPADSRRVTQTLTTIRRERTDCQGVAIIDGDSSRPVLR